jgi:anti-anti-sigma factor
VANVPSAPSGEIDVASAGTFRSDLYQIIDRCDAQIVHVDLHAVTFMDSAGYHALVDADEYAVRNGHVMVLRNLTEQCAMVIGICDWDNELHREDLASAESSSQRSSAAAEPNSTTASTETHVIVVTI